MHKNLIHECLIAPMNLLSALISGEFLKRNQLRYFLNSDEMSPEISIAKIKLMIMKKLIYPMIDYFVNEKCDMVFKVA